MEQQMIFSVSEANNFIKALLDRVPQLQEIFVRGEISNYKLYPSGHHYFTLKDAEGAMRCVLFKGNALRLRFRPENGMKVIAFGRLDALHPLILHGELLFLRLGEDAVRFSDGGFELELVLLKALDQLAQADVLPLGGLCLRQRERVGKGLHGCLHGAGQLAARRAQLAGELGLECGEIGAPALAQETLIVGLALYQPQEQDKRQEREHECRGGKGKGPFIHK